MVLPQASGRDGHAARGGLLHRARTTFAAVRSVGTDVKSTVRTVYDYKVERDGDLISLRVSANGFLYNMARAMAGTCVYAAEGKFPPEAVAQILLNGDRTAAGPTVPPAGFT